ncbi:CBS domain-containing protein CBSX3 [Forsythia ovata]|uniref:CBS domain-containing protein CBSX3 n=1 Tax=Forsythia ovata TaxID=205694 RepID=A0ABD1RJ12_9LAMI
MQGGIQAIFSQGNVLKNAVLKHKEHGFESTKISDILKAKGKNADGSWLWCTTDDTVYDAVKSMTQHNVGALVVVKPGEQKSIAGIITERDYLRKIIVQGRSSKSTKVGDIMTEENKLITVTPDTKVLKAMQLMTDNRIRHIPGRILSGGDDDDKLLNCRSPCFCRVALGNPSLVNIVKWVS